MTEYIPAPLTRLDPDEIRAELLERGATVEDADASAAEQQRRLDAHPIREGGTR